jgi:hypothetical protein
MFFMTDIVLPEAQIAQTGNLSLRDSKTSKNKKFSEHFETRT